MIKVLTAGTRIHACTGLATGSRPTKERVAGKPIGIPCQPGMDASYSKHMKHLPQIPAHSRHNYFNSEGVRFTLSGWISLNEKKSMYSLGSIMAASL